MLTKIFTVSFTILFISCNSYKEVSQKANTNSISTETKMKLTDNQMISEGFNIGEITHLKESECNYIIIDKTTNAKFDPINIFEDTYKSFRNDGEKIYYKYHQLRRMNRCYEISPIKLVDIKKREE